MCLCYRRHRVLVWLFLLWRGLGRGLVCGLDRGWYYYVGGNQFGKHGLQLFVFLLPSWAIVWMYCRIDNVSIIFNIVVGFIF